MRPLKRFSVELIKATSFVEGDDTAHVFYIYGIWDAVNGSWMHRPDGSENLWTATNEHDLASDCDLCNMLNERNATP